MLDRSATQFETRALEPFSVKGKSEPVHVFALGAETATRPESRSGALPFRGRDAELAELCAAGDPTLGTSPRVIVITGDTGIGKSRLVTEALARMESSRHAVIRCEPYTTATPYRALRDTMRGLFGVESPDGSSLTQLLVDVAPDMSAYAPLLGDVTDVDLPSTAEVDAIDPQYRRDRLADLVVMVIDRVVEEPLVFVVDDAHWLDDASSHLLDRIAAESPERGWTVIVARTNDEGGFAPTVARPLTLGPLDDRTMTRLVVDATASAPLRPHAIDEIVGRVGGSPLFLEEVLRTVATTGEATELPDTLESVVARRIDAVSPLARRVLRYAAVLGRSFDGDLAARVLADEGLVLDAAAQEELGEFITSDDDGEFHFRHGIVRDVAYATLPYRRRQALHRRAGEAAEALAGDTESAAEILSLHFSICGDHDRAWRYARLAAEKAKHAYANVEAATH